MAALKIPEFCGDLTETIKMQAQKRNQPDEINNLVQRVQNEDREAFMVLTQLYQRKVFQLAYSYFHNREDAMDIVQETFLRFYQKAHMFQKGKNFQNWLLQIAKNICIDYYRKHHKRDNEWRRDENIEKVRTPSNESSHHDPSSDIKDIFSRCLVKLSDKQRMIFVMKHYNHLHYSEIASILNIALGTVKSLHFKAVRNLRTLMSPYMGRMG
ncbi:MAG: RNA polymerase sigma factor [Candidatus Aminicenantes bacterium]|nr:MAG: RNA polymerase sigma factor [Candidatus Aminicenantes bacterium]